VIRCIPEDTVRGAGGHGQYLFVTFRFYFSSFSSGTLHNPPVTFTTENGSVEITKLFFFFK
jgi:hypothetical protein